MTQDSDGPRSSTGPGADGDLTGRLDRLGKELQRRSDQRAAEDAGSGGARSDVAGLALALRLGSEFVAAVIVGCGIGWGVDRLAGTTPWAMIVFLLLGFAAGVLNVMRSAGLAKKSGE